MTDGENEIFRDPKYDPPYPQGFYRYWPRHVMKAGIAAGLTLLLIVVLSFYFQVPTDPNMPPLPDEGIYVPAPEWYLFFLFQPFWYLTGDNAAWLSAGTFWLPWLVVVFLVLVPFFAGGPRAPGARMTTSKKVLIGVSATLLWAVLAAAVVGSGYPAKTTGCVSCHNPMMGVRQALPPANMGKYYREAREMQIKVGRYRAGSLSGADQGYKDANWQLRHYYEPTMTW